MTPLPIDDKRVGRLAKICDAIDDERPRGPGWKDRHAQAYAVFAKACDLAAANARIARDRAA
jgi:hypothetical protein